MSRVAVAAPRGAASLRELWAYRDLLRHLTGRELKVKYKRSALGWLWSLANPLLVAAVFTLVFAFFLKVPPPAGAGGLHSYGLFLLCALLPWNFTSNVLTLGTASIVGGADLVRKVYFPRAVLVLSHVLAILVAFLIELVVLLGLIVAFGGRLGGALVALPLLIGLQALFATGLALLVAALNVFFRDLQHLIGILLMIWFYGTPVIYPPDRIPAEVAWGGLDVPVKAIMGANPMALFADAYRDVLYHARFPASGEILLIAAISIAVLAVCYRAFRRMEPRFAEEV